MLFFAWPTRTKLHFRNRQKNDEVNIPSQKTCPYGDKFKGGRKAEGKRQESRREEPMHQPPCESYDSIPFIHGLHSLHYTCLPFRPSPPSNSKGTKQQQHSRLAKVVPASGLHCDALAPLPGFLRDRSQIQDSTRASFHEIRTWLRTKVGFSAKRLRTRSTLWVALPLQCPLS